MMFSDLVSFHFPPSSSNTRHCEMTFHPQMEVVYFINLQPKKTIKLHLKIGIPTTKGSSQFSACSQKSMIEFSEMNQNPREGGGVAAISPEGNEKVFQPSLFSRSLMRQRLNCTVSFDG